MFDRITDFNNFEQAYKNTRLGESKYKKEAVRFHRRKSGNLKELSEEVINGTYRSRTYTRFVVKDPKERLIYAPQYRDKIVQHLLNNILAPHMKEYYIEDSYACIVGRGNDRATLKIRLYLSQALKEYGSDAYLVKLDITKFFYSIDRELLKLLLRKYIQCERTLNLLYLIIDTSPEDQGLPLGNLTSQLMANIYLNELDQFCKTVLGFKFYIRYADDIFIMVVNKTKAKNTLTYLEQWIEANLKLIIHETKSNIIPITSGIVALGYNIQHDHIRLLYRTKNKISKLLKEIKGKGELTTLERLKYNEKLNAHFNFIKIANCKGYILSLLAKNTFLELDHKRNVLKIIH